MDCGDLHVNRPIGYYDVSESIHQSWIGALLVLTMGIALATVPVMMFPILSKINKVLALGYVVYRGAFETATYFAMVTSWLLLLTLSQDLAKAGAPDASHFQTLGTLLLESGEWMGRISEIVFCLGALMFYYLLYQSKLIPRWLSGWGLIGATLVLAPVGLLGMFGVDWGFLWAPLAVQEMVMTLWLIVKGFDASAIASLSARPNTSAHGGF